MTGEESRTVQPVTLHFDCIGIFCNRMYQFTLDADVK